MPSTQVQANPNQVSRWSAEPSFRETSYIWLGAAVVFVVFLSLLTPYFALVNNFADSSAYMSIARAIQTWDFHGVVIKHFWGLPYLMAAFSKLTGASDIVALLVISSISSLVAVLLAYRLWGGWIASAFTIISFDWYQRSFLGGSEPLFVALLFASFVAIRRRQWVLAALLASLATITRPLGAFLLLGIGLTLLWRRQWRDLARAIAVGLLIGGLYMIPLALYFHDALATVHSYEPTGGSTATSLFGFPFYAIVKGTILYPSPVSNLVLSFGWIFFVSAGTAAMIATDAFRRYAREHLPEAIFAGPYLLSLYCYNYPVWARSNFARFAIPVIPFVLIALRRWLPQDRRILWLLAPITAVLAASSAVGIQNVAHLLRLTN